MSQKNLKLRITRIREVKDPPRIVTLCGSTRFKSEFEEAQYRETMAGRIVLTVGFYPHADKRSITRTEKEMLDALHLRKIELSDEILVINVGGYIGESTGNEIKHATHNGKVIRYWDQNAIR